MEVRGKCRIVLLRSVNQPWPSARGVSSRLERIYRDWSDEKTTVKCLRIPYQGFRATLLREIRENNLIGIRTFYVVIDTHLSLLELGQCLSFASPSSSFALHLFGDCLVRKTELGQFAQSVSSLKGLVFAASEIMRTEFLAIFPDISVIPFPVDDAYFRKKRRTCVGDAAYVGRICPEKGVPELVSWMESHPGIPFRIFGHWPGKVSLFHGMPEAERGRSLRELENKIASSGTRVESWASDRRGAECLSSLGMMITFSRFTLEEFGLAIAEALASGCPVVCTDWMGHREFREAPFLTLLPVTDTVIETTGLEEKLHALRRLPFRERKKIRRWARSRFSREAVSEKLLHYYRKSFSSP